jgi:hypothetical protein
VRPEPPLRHGSGLDFLASHAAFITDAHDTDAVPDGERPLEPSARVGYALSGMRSAARHWFVAVLVLPGCYQSYRDHGDGAQADVDAAPVEQCPESIPMGGPGRLAVVWRRMAADDWGGYYPPALAMTGGVVLAVKPMEDPATRSLGPPALVRLSAADGSPLTDGPTHLDDIAPTWAVGTAGPSDDSWLAALADAGGADRFELWRSRLTSSGATLDLVEQPAPGLEVRRILNLQAAHDRANLYVVVSGTGSSGMQAQAIVAPLSTGILTIWPLSEGWSDDGAGFVAWAEGDRGDGIADTVAWTSPAQVVLTSATGDNLATWDLPTPSPYLPVAAAPMPSPGELRYVFAGRSDDVPVGSRMWTEIRDGRDLHHISGVVLDDLETLVDHPEPRALERSGDGFVLAWAARRVLDGAPRASCLYLTGLDAAGSPTGTTIRVDPGGEAILPGIDQVRLVEAPEGTFVSWQHGAELWVARVEWSS